MEDLGDPGGKPPGELIVVWLVAAAACIYAMVIAVSAHGQTIAPITGHGDGSGGPARNVRSVVSGIAIGAGDVFWSQFGRAVLWRASASGDIAAATTSVVALPAGIAGFTGLCSSSAYLYGVDQYSHTVWRRPFFAGAIWERVAGQIYMPGDQGRGGPASAALLNAPAGCVVAPDGALYVSEFGNAAIVRIDPTGILTRYAGGGTASCSGCVATSARLRAPWGLALTPDGTLYLADAVAHVVQRVTPSGIIETAAGTGSASTACPVGSATSTAVGAPRAVEIGPDGAIYIAAAGGNCIARLNGSTLTRFAGGGQVVPSGPMPATDATIEMPSALRLVVNRLLIGAQGTKQPGIYSIELGAVPQPTATNTTAVASPTATRTATAIPATATRTATRTNTPLPTCDLGQCVPPGGT